METTISTGTEAGKAFVNSLYQEVVSASDKSLMALEELSSIAMGGHEQARRLISMIDEKVLAGELILPKADKPNNT